MGPIESKVLGYLDNKVNSASFTVGTEAANIINVAVQLKNIDGKDMTEAAALLWYLAADSAGMTIGTAPSVGTSIGTDGLLIEWTANVAGLVISEADGDIDVNLEEAGALTNYLVLVLPNGSLTISGAITHAA